MSDHRPLASLGRLLDRRRVLPELPSGGDDRAPAKATVMIRKNTAAAHWSPGVCGSEGEDEGRTPVASSAEPQANTNATAATPARAPRETPAFVNGS
jgi:hypothetical protein